MIDPSNNMKYRVQRKLNLANIDSKLWPYETEDIGVEDADSFEEAQQTVDKLVAERIGYYKAKAEEYHKLASPINNSNEIKPSPVKSEDTNIPKEFQV